ncbi:MAG: hypothetical protein IJZ90_04195 [Clostridia bacterium]|nr:hypothetical protein [Clostridia bacterium]
MKSKTESFISTFICGHLNGISCDLFSAEAFKCAGVFASCTAENISKELNKELIRACCDEAVAGEFYAKSGYINLNFGNEYITRKINILAEKFDILYGKGKFDKFLYGKSSAPGDSSALSVWGLHRYCVNRIISVCDIFETDLLHGNAGKEKDSRKRMGDSANFCDNKKLRDIAVLCIYLYFLSGNCDCDMPVDEFFCKYIAADGYCLKKAADSAAELFCGADGCVCDLSMIYLNIYKSLGFVLYNIYS